MSVWPDKLMIRDTGIYEDCGRRIHTTAGYGYEKVEYTRTDTDAIAALVGALQWVSEGAPYAHRSNIKAVVDAALARLGGGE